MSFVLSYLQSIIEQESDQNKNHVIVQEMKLLVLHSLKIMKGEKKGTKWRNFWSCTGWWKLFKSSSDVQFVSSSSLSRCSEL